MTAAAARSQIAQIPTGPDQVLALSNLVSQFYDDVRVIAHARLRRLPSSRTMHTATLLQEALLRLARQKQRGWACRVHFFADVSQAMRQVVVDYVRRKNAGKRAATLVCDDDAMDRARAAQHSAVATPAQKLAIQQALERLQAHRPRAATIVLYRFYCGLTMSQIAEALDISLRCAEREWAWARSWLAAELGAR